MKVNRVLVLLPAIFLLFNSCEQNEVQSFKPSIDEEFDKADILVDAFIKDKIADGSMDEEARSYVQVHITVLLFDDSYDDGVLVYNTNRDYWLGFREVTEETVTADVKPGDYVVWLAAGKIQHLEGIVFDPESEQELDKLPEDHVKRKLWYVQMPQDIDPQHLKYDILYQLRGSEDLIRLDPKLKVHQ